MMDISLLRRVLDLEFREVTKQELHEEGLDYVDVATQLFVATLDPEPNNASHEPSRIATVVRFEDHQGLQYEICYEVDGNWTFTMFTIALSIIEC